MSTDEAYGWRGAPTSFVVECERRRLCLARLDEQTIAAAPARGAAPRGSHGWWLEHDGELVGVLYDRAYDQPWTIYTLRAFPESPSPLGARLADAAWWQTDAWTALTIRSRASGTIGGTHAMPGLVGVDDDGRVWWRGL